MSSCGEALHSMKMASVLSKLVLKQPLPGLPINMLICDWGDLLISILHYSVTSRRSYLQIPLACDFGFPVEMLGHKHSLHSEDVKVLC